MLTLIASTRKHIGDNFRFVFIPLKCWGKNIQNLRYSKDSTQNVSHFLVIIFHFFFPGKRMFLVLARTGV